MTNIIYPDARLGVVAPWQSISSAGDDRKVLPGLQCIGLAYEHLSHRLTTHKGKAIMTPATILVESFYDFYKHSNYFKILERKGGFIYRYRIFT